MFSAKIAIFRKNTIIKIALSPVIIILEDLPYKFMGRSRGGAQGVWTPLENHKWLYVSLEILVRTFLVKQLDLTALCEIRWWLKKVFRNQDLPCWNFLVLRMTIMQCKSRCILPLLPRMSWQHTIKVFDPLPHKALLYRTDLWYDTLFAFRNMICLILH